MYKPSFLLFLICVIIAFAGVSCNRVVEPEPLNREDALQVLNLMKSDMELTMQEVEETQGMATMKYLMGLMLLFDDSIVIPQHYVKSLIMLTEGTPHFNQVQKVSAPILSFFEDQLGFEYFAGTLSWNHNDGEWEYLSQPTDSLIVNFPSSSNQELNDATFSIWNYIELVQNEDTLLTSIKVNLMIDMDEEEDNDEQMLLNINYFADVSNNIFNDMSLQIDIEPFFMEYSLTYTPQDSNSILNFSHIMWKEDLKLSSSNLEFLVKDMPSVDPFLINDFPENITPGLLYGYYMLYGVKFQLELKLDEFYQAIENDEGNPLIADAANSYLKVTLYTYPQGEKIASVKWIWENELESLVPYFLFNDGSELPASDFIPQLFLPELFSFASHQTPHKIFAPMVQSQVYLR